MQVLRMRSTARAASLLALAAVAAGCGGADGGTAPAAKLLAAVTTHAAPDATTNAAATGATTANGGAHGGADVYGIVNLAPGIGYRTSVNARGQAAFEHVNRGGSLDVGFYDGDRIADVAMPGALATSLGRMNAHGVVIAQSRVQVSPSSIPAQPFRWTRAGGPVALPVFDPEGNNYPDDMNDRGTIVGFAGIGPLEADYRAVRWSPANALAQLPTPPGFGLSDAVSVNRHDASTGFANDAAGVAHAFVWGAGGSPTDLGTFGAATAHGRSINDGGEVAGQLDLFLPSFQSFLWSPGKGAVRVGLHTVPGALNNAGELVGRVYDPDTIVEHAFLFTRARGLVDLHPAPFSSSTAEHVNDGGTIVGEVRGASLAEGQAAYRWSRTGAPVDLNTRLVDKPDGLVLTQALQVSPTGDIVANSNAGLVLLRRGGGGGGAPVLGPIRLPAEVRPGQPFELVLSFRDRDPADTHAATIDWGDGAGPQPVPVSEGAGSGEVRVTHTYPGAGDYTIVAAVTDATGRTTTQYRNLYLFPYCVPGITGEARLADAPGAAPRPALTFRLAAPLVAVCGNTRPFTFALQGRLWFKGDRLERIVRNGNTVRLEGTGKLDGQAGYRFTIDATDGNRDGRVDPDRLAIRIVRPAPAGAAQAAATQQVVLDYGAVTSKSRALRGEGVLPASAIRLVE
ncbi:PKD domain-containing protein [uncultured Massilia sp.]|uniref:PKD domain-containing protein n=1 Tax=uncultured Massilia sp. TaxID=169973 RepID=UPI0025FFADC0|nr:PKD domain-containing protein [uncultured Massilia sp.]